MRKLPIPFSAPMVRAILQGRKTQTRRVLKPQPDDLLEGQIPNALRTSIGDLLFPAMSIPSLNRNYCADTHGQIWSRARNGHTWQLLSPSPTSKGYLSVTPAHDGKYSTRNIHKLVAEAFYGEAPPGMDQVRHLNGNQTDNAPENLDYGTQADNWSDRAAHGRSSGEDHHAAKLTRAMIEEIRASSLSQRRLAALFGVAQSQIWAIKAGKTWQDNPKAKPPNIPRWASRITLRVTDVKVERLQDISRGDAMLEGCPFPNMQAGPNPRDWFRDLWDEINGPGSWEANPWVAAYIFQPTFRNIHEVKA